MVSGEDQLGICQESLEIIGRFHTAVVTVDQQGA
jgi:hypothetical protein